MCCCGNQSGYVFDEDELVVPPSPSKIEEPCEVTEDWVVQALASSREIRAKACSSTKPPHETAAELSEAVKVWAAKLLDKHLHDAAEGKTIPDLVVLSVSTVARQEMAPYSDFDIVVLSQDSDRETVKKIVIPACGRFSDHTPESKGGFASDWAQGDVLTPEEFARIQPNPDVTSIYSRGPKADDLVKKFWKAREGAGTALTLALWKKGYQLFTYALNTPTDRTYFEKTGSINLKTHLLRPISELFAFLEEKQSGRGRPTNISTTARIKNLVPEDETFKADLLKAFGTLLDARCKLHCLRGKDDNLLTRKEKDAWAEITEKVPALITVMGKLNDFAERKNAEKGKDEIIDDGKA